MGDWQYGYDNGLWGMDGIPYVRHNGEGETETRISEYRRISSGVFNFYAHSKAERKYSSLTITSSKKEKNSKEYQDQLDKLKHESDRWLCRFKKSPVFSICTMIGYSQGNRSNPFITSKKIIIYFRYYHNAAEAGIDIARKGLNVTLKISKFSDYPVPTQSTQAYCFLQDYYDPTYYSKYADDDIFSIEVEELYPTYC
ncbi:hypothetical protein [Vibrio anguillarum]|uniref:hypothetical protein n=1 Tax=Vibrio anguillarum TaxID=55601 RepID=UPI0009804D6D|nr:hypothetical protein [Vibrio anguillarum]AQP37149.1 hypothetical protein AA909_12660 [Vibrio anguillarum]